MQQKGLLTAEEWNEVTQLLDEMDDMPDEAWTEKLQALRDRVKARMDRGGQPDTIGDTTTVEGGWMAR